MDIQQLIFKELKIEHICKATLKNSYISVSHSKITLKTPKVSKQYIEQLLVDKESWIRKQLFKQEQKEVKKINLEDEVLLFGEIYSIDIDEVYELRKYLLKLKISNRENILKAYDKFYKQYAQNYLTPRLEYFSQLMGLKYTEIKFRKMKSRWGSCSSRGTITLNTQLIKVKKELIDYVIVHELAHLKHMNHSKRFHSLVEEYLSDSYSLRKELKNISV
ncbi:MAG: SprT family zinc-dependent metalloprotease [Campylobacterota bacterium]|nr:SprT family zinc-dependent metalloprotease [Campylobacterota bacterium]